MRLNFSYPKMFLKKINVLQYKNIRSRELIFSEKINCIVGNNGVGKTNLLDAIYHLGMTKSYLSTHTQQNIMHGEDFYMLEGIFEKDARTETIVCSMKKGQKKVIKRNAKPYERISEHLGSFPVVMVSPADRDLVTESSEHRRKFIDGVIAQTQPTFLSQLLSYNKILAQRNTLLKQMAQNPNIQNDTLLIYDEQLAFFAEQIYHARSQFLQEFIPVFTQQYRIVSAQQEQVNIIYKSHLSEKKPLDILKDNYTKDRTAQYTTQGIHKDDLLFLIQDYPVKKYASQGQQKSFLISLKMAQYQFIKQKVKFAPILLLDDIFDKLDHQRVSQIMHLVSGEDFGQIFISDTDRQRTQSILQEAVTDYKIFEM